MGSLVMEVNDVQESNGAIDRRTLLRVLTAGLSSASVGRLSRLGATAVGAAGAAQAEPDVFEIHVGDQALDDLHRRLSTVRWPGDSPGEAWSYGVDRAYLEELMAYWRDDYDWRVHEAALNAFDHFTTTIDGQLLHFVHQRGRGLGPWLQVAAVCRPTDAASMSCDPVSAG
jgi:hypothetical protein